MWVGSCYYFWVLRATFTQFCPKTEFQSAADPPVAQSSDIPTRKDPTASALLSTHCVQTQILFSQIRILESG